MVTVSLLLLSKSVRTTIFRDRFRTAINVFGDSIGCAIVQHLSRKELAALDNKETSLEDDDKNTVVPLLVPVNTHTQSSNRVLPITYDNPTFVDQPETISDDDNDNNMARTHF